MNQQSRLSFFPVSFFAMVMGLTGYVLVLQKAESLWLATSMVSLSVLILVSLLFVTLLGFYLAKWMSHTEAVKAEWNNPIRMHFFPTISISFLLLAIAYLEVNSSVSRILWIIGTALHLLATLAILSAWIRQTKYEIHHFNPAWFIPIVGNILVPVAGVQFAGRDLLWFFFSIGIIFWLPMFTILLYRIIFHHPIAEKLIPTFFILIAPPAVGYVSYVKLTGALDNFATVLYFFALFLVLLLLTQFKMFYGIRFYLSWWAYSFPIAATAIASFSYYKMSESTLGLVVFATLSALLTVLVLVLLGFTLRAIGRNEICVKEE